MVRVCAHASVLAMPFTESLMRSEHGSLLPIGCPQSESTATVESLRGPRYPRNGSSRLIYLLLFGRNILISYLTSRHLLTGVDARPSHLPPAAIHCDAPRP